MINILAKSCIQSHLLATYAVMASKSPNRKLVCAPMKTGPLAVARVTDYMYVYIVTTIHTLCNERGRVVGRGWNMRWEVLKLTKCGHFDVETFSQNIAVFVVSDGCRLDATLVSTEALFSHHSVTPQGTHPPPRSPDVFMGCFH